MPAVQVQRLQKQIRELLWKFTRPDEFAASLDSLLDFYGNRVYRAGQSITQGRQSLTFRVPHLVMHTLERELDALCKENPIAALALADRLWQEKMLEPRQLAAAILGLVPISEAQTVLDKIETWTQAGGDSNLLRMLISKGSARIRLEQPNRWLELCLRWLERTDAHSLAAGIQAASALLEDRSFLNLPPIYDAITPLIIDPPQTLLLELQRLVALLLVCSPGETVYILKQILLAKPNVNSRKLIRSLLPKLSPADQDEVRALMTSGSAA